MISLCNCICICHSAFGHLLKEMQWSIHTKTVFIKKEFPLVFKQFLTNVSGTESLADRIGKWYNLAHNSVIFGPILKILIWLYSGDQELSNEHHIGHFRAQFKYDQFCRHIWAWAGRLAHLAQRSQNITKSSP